MSGRIFTFYSWKGGVGRTMTLASAGVQLARRGKRVLLIDWDLEAPGLERYFLATDAETKSHLSISLPSDRSGLLGLLAGAANGMRTRPEIDAVQGRCVSVMVPELPKSTRGGIALPRPQPLQVLGSGSAAADYAAQLQSFSWVSFFAESDGGR